MGDKVQREKPENLKKEKELLGKKKYRNITQTNNTIINPKKKTKITSSKNYSITKLDIGEQLTYKPRTKETQQVYEELLTMVQVKLDSESHSTIKGALDEILAILKIDDKRDSDRKSEIEIILGRLSNEDFSKMLQLSKQLIDYGAEIEDTEAANTDLFGVNMELENEEQENDDEMENEKVDEEDEFSDEYERKKEQQGDDYEDEALHQIGIDDQDDFEQENSSIIKDIEKIDGYWLQTELNKYFDHNILLKLEKEILKILHVGDKRECENKLVMLLSQEKFPFIKLLLENRWAIYYKVRLGQAQSQEEKAEIISEMEKTQEGREVQAKIQSSKLRKDKDKEFSKNIKKEYHTIKTKLTTSSLIDGDMKISAETCQKQRKNLLNLESLQFEGTHVMTNTSCNLPKGSIRETKKGYEEVYIPPVINRIDDSEKIVKVEEIPSWMHVSFQSKDKNGKVTTMDKFNRVQSKVLPSALYSDENMLICAPTSSGKTIIAVLTILRLISLYRNKNGSINLKNFKIVFIAPMKALVKETVGNLTSRLVAFDMVVRELSGDVSLTKQELDETHVIVATPEKWDIITRKTGERTFTDLIKLIIIDEIHLLHDSRGPVLESIVARTIRRIESTKDQIRIVALSATLPNFEDVATFLRIDFKKGLYYFDNSYRPVPLKQHYIGITEKKSVKKMLLMNEITYDKVIERAGKHQMIIFVHSRRETVRTAKAIREMAIAKDDIGKFMREEGSYKEILQSELGTIKDNDLKDLLPYCNYLNK